MINDLQKICKEHDFYKVSWDEEELTFFSNSINNEPWGRSCFKVDSRTYKEINDIEDKLLKNHITSFKIYF